MWIVADSGSTKTSWMIGCESGDVIEIAGPGINPVLMTEEEIKAVLQQDLAKVNLNGNEVHVAFYGAGCALPEYVSRVEKAFSSYFSTIRTMIVRDDLWGAAIALRREEPGLCAILGTGSHVGYFDGKGIAKKIAHGGYMLGDYGSGNHLGKALLQAYLDGGLVELQETFLQESQLTRAELMNKLYRQAFPNRFLASFAPFMFKYKNHPEIQKLIHEVFSVFVKKYVMQFHDFPTRSLHVCGSIGSYFQSELASVLASFEYSLGTVNPSPVKALFSYHVSKG